MADGKNFEPGMDESNSEEFDKNKMPIDTPTADGDDTETTDTPGVSGTIVGGDDAGTTTEQQPS